MSLTTSQRAAVHFDDNLIIFAGPGSGKTSASVAKGVRILSAVGTTLGMMTFTTAAAGEMRERMARAARLQGAAQLGSRLLVGTFNAIALRHYQRYAQSPSKLLPPPARAAMLGGMLRSLDSDAREKHTAALDRYQTALHPNDADFDSEHLTFIRTYLRKLEASHAIDLATIMRECTLRMGSGEMPLLSVTHLIGDEMQDADEVQVAFMLIHSKAGVKTTLVADDDQTIYEWRNALGYQGLQYFANEAGAKTIVLGENFRSRNEIVAHATELIAFNDPHRIPKNQKAIRGPGGTLLAVSCTDLKSECLTVAEMIQHFRKEGESIAILARTNVALWSAQTALTTAEIPFRREGPSMWDTPELALFLALLRALVTLRTADLLPVLTASKLDNALVFEMAKTLGRECRDFLDGEIPDLNSATALDRTLLEKFVDATSKWRAETQRGMFDIVISEVASFMQELLQDAIRDEDTRRRAERRVPKLLADAVHVLTQLKGKLSTRLTTIQTLQQAEGRADAVRLLTMHSSKGLEFDTVFLIDANKPSDGSSLVDADAERRLFYVALTRAKERFVVSYSDSPVQFIREAGIPFELAMSPAFA